MDNGKRKRPRPGEVDEHVPLPRPAFEHWLLSLDSGISNYDAAKQWNLLAPQQKQPYTNLANLDKERYQAQQVSAQQRRWHL